MKQYKIEQGSTWQTLDNSMSVIVRKVFVEDGETFVWYGEHASDRTFECGPEEFVQRFKEAE